MAVTPTDVRNTSLLNFFGAFTDEQIQPYIDCVTPWFSAAHVMAHSQREDVITWMVAHVIWLQFQAETAANGGGGGGGAGPISEVKLEGVGTKKWAVSAVDPDDVGDLLKAASPFLRKLSWLIDTLPSGMTVTTPVTREQVFFPPLFAWIV